MMVKMRVLLADDHNVVRAGLRSLVDAQDDMEVVAEAADGEAACRLAAELAPDVVVLDISMPLLGGAEAAGWIVRQHPKTRVLALTVHEDHSYLHQLMQAGASGYLLKRAAAEDLIHAIRVVARGGTYLDTELTARVIGHLMGRDSVPGPAIPVILSDREEEVLRLISRGHTNREVAEKLDISIKTVETHKSRGMEKLNVKTRAGIVNYAIRVGWMAEHR